MVYKMFEGFMTGATIGYIIVQIIEVIPLLVH
jgi:hypothetical protein